jgi:hypothetical protein
MTITKTCFRAAPQGTIRIGDGADSIEQPRSSAVAAIEARRIDVLIRSRAELRDLVALERGRANLGE